MAAVVTVVVGGGGVHSRAPKGALVIGDGCWLGAVVRWIQGGVSLDEDVETCAEGFVVTVFGTLLYVIGFESLETQVCVGRD